MKNSYLELNGFLGCCAEPREVRVLNATSSFRMDKVGMDKVETCSSVEEALIWGHGVVVNTQRDRKLVGRICTEGTVRRRGIQEELRVGRSDCATSL